ncbi:hypothetical protein LXL04_029189 [Taraxacum kok-saghyz]
MFREKGTKSYTCKHGRTTPTVDKEERKQQETHRNRGRKAVRSPEEKLEHVGMAGKRWVCACRETGESKVSLILSNLNKSSRSRRTEQEVEEEEGVVRRTATGGRKGCRRDPLQRLRRTGLPEIAAHVGSWAAAWKKEENGGTRVVSLLLVKPLVSPTKAIMSVHINTYAWKEFFPQSRNNIGVMLALWAPIILVYFMDTQIWYAVFSTLFGGVYGAFCRLGEIRNLTTLRSHFMSLPGVLNMHLIPPKKSDEDIRIALDMARNSNGKDRELKKRIENDNYMSCAVRECYASFRIIIKFLVSGRREQMVIDDIFSEVDKHIEEGALVRELNMHALPILFDHIVKLINYLLSNKQEDRNQVVILFQDMHEVVTRDIMEDQFPNLDGPGYEPDEQYQLCSHADAILFPIKRLYLLLTVKESAMDVPSNLEARRRISFFSNSLFMDMPSAPKVRDMLSFSVITPIYSEVVLFSMNDLDFAHEDEISILFYLQKIFPDEWSNFLERMGCQNEEDLNRNHELEDQVRLWASYRGQTLAMTVRGMMYYRQALELQAFLDMAKDEVSVRTAKITLPVA